MRNSLSSIVAVALIGSLAIQPALAETATADAALDQYVQAKPASLQPFYRSLYAGGERNAVLNYERLALAAMEVGEYKAAEKALDEALLRIEAVYAKNAQAEAARSIFRKEANKSFKGEPYERAMAYYYRGLLYMRAGDYENARAAFKTAEYQNMVSEQEDYKKSSFVLMDYLSGWASQCNGQASLAKDAFDIVKASDASFVPPAADDNVLFIAELGRGPVKVKDGKQKEKLSFRPYDAAPETTAIYTIKAGGTADQTFKLTTLDRVSTEATTRNGQAIDSILAGKASWKSATAGVGQGAMAVGTGLMQAGLTNNNAGMAQMGGYAALAGLAFSMMSSSMKPDADTRMWDTLPDRINLRSAKLTATDWETAVSFHGDSAPVTLPTSRIMRQAAKSCTIVWTRSRSALDAPAAAPGDDENVARNLSRRRDVKAKDDAFRAALLTS